MDVDFETDFDDNDEALFVSSLVELLGTVSLILTVTFMIFYDSSYY